MTIPLCKLIITHLVKFKLRCYSSSYFHTLWFNLKQPRISPKLNPINQVQSILDLSPRTFGPNPSLDQVFFIGPYWANNLFNWPFWVESPYLGPKGSENSYWAIYWAKNLLLRIFRPKNTNMSSIKPKTTIGPKVLIGCHGAETSYLGPIWAETP